ncbi:MAG: polysaccharide biosynthesis protein [Flavobacteriales bacterium]
MQTVLITGGAGYLGKQLGLKLKDRYNVILGSRNNGNNQLAQTLTGCETIPLDVVNYDSLLDAYNRYKPEIIIHAAATKFVDISEKNPMECIDVNVLGSQNIARLAIDKGVKVVVGVSTDKTAPPVGNIYGHSKAMMERMFCTLDNTAGTRFVCTRFGNIAWSTGSVFPLWKRIMASKGVIETTGPHMRRFIFSVSEAADLVIRAMEGATGDLGGKILSLKMKSAMMEDILKVWTKHLGGTYKKIGERPGDKLDEHLIGDIECVHTIEKDIDGIPHYIIDFKQKFENHVPEYVSSENAPRLTDEEILHIISNPPSFASI